MTDAEYDQANLKITATFPSLGSWFNRLDVDTKAAQRERRKAVLLPLEARDVLNAVTDLSRGAESPWSEYGAEEWAYNRIAAKAREFSAKRKHREEERGLLAVNHGTGLSLRSIRELADELVTLKKSDGWTPGNTRDWLDREIPEDPNDKREWAKCTACRDTGLILVLSTIRRVEDRVVHSTAAAACHCERGRVFAERKDEAARLPLYDECEQVRLPIGCSGEDAERALLATRDRRAKKNRVKSWDDWNDREIA
jgi:hypothetical protein